MKAEQKNIAPLQTFFCLLVIFFCGIGEACKYFIIGGTGVAIGKLLIALPILFVPLLLPSLLSTVGIPCGYKEHGMGRLTFYVILSVFFAGAFTGLIYPLSTATPFYQEYYFPDALIILAPCLWIVAFPFIFKSGKGKTVLKILISQVFFIVIGLFFFMRNSEQLYLSHLIPSLIIAYLIIQLVDYKKTGMTYLSLFLEICLLFYLLVFYALGYHRISFIAFILIFLLGFLIISLTVAKNPLLIFVAAIILYLFVGFGENLAHQIVGVADSELSQSRFYKTFVEKEAFTDESSSSRIDEIEDCLNMILDDFPTSILGYGHGASYRPVQSPIISNATPDGVIHNIHFGPVLLLFRYGIFGIAFYLLLVWILWQGFCQIIMYIRKSANIPKELLILYIASYLNLLAIWVKLHAQNTLIDPMFAVSIGIVCTNLKDDNYYSSFK